jgi:hypothetical protein
MVREKDELSEFIKEKIAKIKELAPMNKQLKKWIEEQETKPSSSSATRKKIAGMCQKCNKRTARFRCIKCGAQVCAACYWVLFGLCKKCASEDTVQRWKGEHKKMDVDFIK